MVVRLGSVEPKTLFRFASGGWRSVVGDGRMEPRVLGIVVLKLGAYEDGTGPLARVLGSHTF